MQAVPTVLLIFSGTAAAAPPNVVFVLTDDQDVMLGSMDSMNRTRSLLTEQGVTFKNYFCNTPICCPSRAEIQTGRHMHNTKVYGNSCGGADFKNGAEKLNVAYYAKTKGYTSFYGGKYLNNYGSKTTGGLGYIPRGWDSWYGLQGNSKYYGYTVSNNGVAEQHGHDYFQDYFTDYLANKSVAFVENVTAPFFVMIGTPASHIPDDYAPWTENMFNHTLAPRSPNWNVCPNPSKHAMMRGIEPMKVGDPAVDKHDTEFGSDWVHIKRLRTLQSVDVMIERLVNAVDAKGQLSSTYFFLSSDNGYHLGQFGLAYDKRQMYEEDIRVPLVVRGPGIAPNSITSLVSAHIDLTPTILAIMGIPTPVQMDGASWLSHLQKSQQQSQQRQGHEQAAWRTEMLIEYNGPSFNTSIVGTRMGGDTREESEGGGMLRSLDQLEVDVDDQGRLFDMLATPSDDDATTASGSAVRSSKSASSKCKWFSNASTSACDPASNTYACVRSIGSSIDSNSVYCEFSGEGDFVEYYDIDNDPFQLANLARNATTNGTSAFKGKMASLARRLRAHMACAGAACLNPPDLPVPAPTPPGPHPHPHPPPPAPTPPAGAVRYSLKGQGCLSLGVGGGKKFALVMAPCRNSSTWTEGVDTKGSPQIFNAGGDTCLNLLDDTCKVGNSIHGGPCQKDAPKKTRTGDHFRWDKDATAIVCTACEGKGGGLCVDYHEGGSIQLATCDQAQGWTREAV